MARKTNDNLIRVKDVPDVVLEMTGQYRGESTVRKWMTQGVHGRDGRVHLLQSTRRIKAICTTRVWLSEFFNRIA